jgi:hypothetical protein
VELIRDPSKKVTRTDCVTDDIPEVVPAGKYSHCVLVPPGGFPDGTNSRAHLVNHSRLVNKKFNRQQQENQRTSTTITLFLKKRRVNNEHRDATTERNKQLVQGRKNGMGNRRCG